jgi:2,5-diketo-D-gluconate reductase A
VGALWKRGTAAARRGRGPVIVGGVHVATGALPLWSLRVVWEVVAAHWHGRDGRAASMSESRTIASERVELASGAKMPILGLGTWQLRGSSTVGSVLRALEVGYRHIDTATVYGNEEQVGQAVAKSGLRREDIFVTTKLPPSRAGRERETLVASLDALAFGYVDLWLIHWPPSGGARPDVWERLLELQAEGLTRDVGVSNYSVLQIDELQRATGQLPAVNQIEWSPPLFDADVLEAHRRRGVQLEGYSPLQTVNLRDPRLVRIAESHCVTWAQVVLRWHIEHRIVAIPRSANAERIAENVDIFDFSLTSSEVELLDSFASERRAGSRSA